MKPTPKSEVPVDLLINAFNEYTDSKSEKTIVSGADFGSGFKAGYSAALSVQTAEAVVGEPVVQDIDWGGQAFPSEGGSDSGLHPDPGMSLRDFHASSALKGFCANPAIFAGNDYSGWALVNCTEEQLAVVCHRLADAMIAARKKVASHE